MKLDSLPQHIQKAIVDLTVDQQFQKRFAEDEQLDYIQSLKHDKQIEFYELQLAVNKKIILFGIELNPITLALYSYLYSIKSNIIFDIDKITTIDLDVFFYLLQTKDYNFDLKELFNKAVGYCQNTMKLNTNRTIELFNRIYKIEFRCLNLFPRSNQQKEPLFNIDWMISIVSKIKPLTSYSTEQLYKDVSLSQIYYYFANYCRMQGDQSIFIRTEDEILFEEDLRMCELVVDRLIEKGVIFAEERDNIIKEMKQENE